MRFLILLFFVVSSSSLWAQQRSTRPTAARRNAVPPNIIYIMADDLGYGDLGSYGQKVVATPSLDRLAGQGTRFSRFYAGSTVCAPSRCALMTGKHTGHGYIRGNGEIPLRSTDTTLAQRLKSRGYTTGMFGKWGLGLEGNTGAPQRKGWDTFLGYLDHKHAHNYHTDHLWQVQAGQLSKRTLDTAQYTHDLIMDGAMAFVKDNKTGPFLLYLPVTLVHAELATTPADIAPFLTTTGQSVFAPEKPFLKPPKSRYNSQPNPKATFAAMLTRLDRDVGKLLALLTELGLDQNTYIFFTSDNGPHQEAGANPVFFDSNGPLRGIKRDMYEGGIRVPMLVRGPGVPVGRVSDQSWANWDILPTFCQLSGAPRPGGIDGVSMVNLMHGQAITPATERVFFWQFNEGELRQAVVQGNWKLIRLKKPDQPERIELYDLGSDLAETTNLADQNKAKVQALVALMQTEQSPSEHPLFNWK